MTIPYYSSIPYGSGGYGGVTGLAAMLRDRTLRFVRMGTNMRGIVGVTGDIGAAYRKSAQDVIDAFDLDTAEGEQLDRIGELLQRDRFGSSDEDYRTLLDIQIRLILSSTASTPILLEIVELFLGVPASEYSESYPRGFSIGATVSSLEEADQLLELICTARAAGFRYQLNAALDDEPLLGDFDDSSVSDPGLTDFDDSSVVGAFNTVFADVGG